MTAVVDGWLRYDVSLLLRKKNIANQVIVGDWTMKYSATLLLHIMLYLDKSLSVGVFIYVCYRNASMRFYAIMCQAKRRWCSYSITSFERSVVKRELQGAESSDITAGFVLPDGSC